MPAALVETAHAELVEQQLRPSVYDFAIKRHDESPALEIEVLLPDGTLLDLAPFIGAAFYMSGRDASGARVLRIADAAEIDVAGKKLRYSWQAGDTVTSGNFEAEFELLELDGQPRTVPTNGHILVRVVDDLDDA